MRREERDEQRHRTTTTTSPTRQEALNSKHLHLLTYLLVKRDYYHCVMADTPPTHRHATTHGHPRHEAHNDHEPGRTVPITHAHTHRSQRQLTCQNRHVSSRDLPRPPECTPEPPPTPGKHRGRCPVQLSPLSKYGKCMEQPPRRPGSTPVPPPSIPSISCIPKLRP